MPRKDSGSGTERGADKPEPMEEDSSSPGSSPGKVDKVAVATKHPGVFMETSEMEKETGKKLPVGIEIKEVSGEETAGEKRRTRTSSRSRSPDQKKKGVVDAAGSVPIKKEGPKEQQPTVGAGATSGEVEVSVGEGSEDKSEKEKKEDEKVETRVTRSSRRFTRRQQAQKEEEEEKKRTSALSAPVATVTGTTTTTATATAAAVTATATAKEDDSATATATTTEGETSEAESECSTRDNESVASGSTLTTRSSIRNRRDLPQGADAKAGGASGASSTDGGRSRSGSKIKQNRNRGGGINATSKGKSRRHIFKKSASKAPAAVARTVTSNRIFYNGQFFTRGDIVSVTDLDGGIYYAQLRGFMTDQYCEKSGVLTWLLPTEGAPRPEDGFDASKYVIGPEEELPRKLSFFTFVMHAPDDYFYHRTAPYPTRSHSSDQEYVLTRAGPKVRLLKQSGRAVYQDASRF